MDIQTMLPILRSKVGSPTTADVPDALLTRVINDAYKFICARYPFHETRTIGDIDTVASTGSYDVPEDLLVLYRVWDDTNKKKLKKRGPRYLGSIPLNQPTAKPLNYVRAENQLYVFPIPDAIYTLKLFYLRVPDLLEDTTDTPVIPSTWHDGLVLKARHLYYDERGDIGKALYAKNEWKDWVSDKPSEMDQEKDDYDDTAVIIPSLGGEFGRRNPRDDSNWDNEL